MTQITVAALQLAFTADIDRNIVEVSRLAGEARHLDDVAVDIGGKGQLQRGDGDLGHGLAL